MTKDEALTLALEALERASHSLGSFVSDHGWGQEDMDTFDSVMAAEHRIKEALAQPTSGDYALGYAEGFNDACKRQPERTGWPAGLLQDDDRKLSKWLSSKPDAKHVVDTERYFCPRCGKKLKGMISPGGIHTCTPPHDKTR